MEKQEYTTCLVKVDNIQLLTRNTMEHTSFFVQEDMAHAEL